MIIQSEELTPLVLKDELYVNKDRLYTAFLASVIGSISSLSFGYTLGYPTASILFFPNASIFDYPNVSIFDYPNASAHALPTSYPFHALSQKYLYLDMEHYSWFESLIAIGAIIGSILAGLFIDMMGRKATIMVTGIFFIPGWILISYSSKNIAILYIGRVLTGIGVGMSSLAVPVYIAEVSSARYRGVLGAMKQLAITIGAFLVNLVGVYESWNKTALLGVVLVFVNLLLMLLMPESPRWLVSKNQRPKALLELKWLRGPTYDVENECCEIENNLEQQVIVSLNDFKTPGLYRPLLVGSVLFVIQQFSSINYIILICFEILSIPGTHEIKVVFFVIGLAQIFLALVACLVVDKLGRRCLLMFGSLVLCLCTLILAVYYTMKKVPSIDLITVLTKRTVGLYEGLPLPLVCTSVFIIVYSYTWGPLPWVIMSEIFPPRARGFASGSIMAVCWAMIFVGIKIARIIFNTFYQQGALFFSSAIYLASFFFVFFFVPETNGKTLEEIEHYFLVYYGFRNHLF